MCKQRLNVKEEESKSDTKTPVKRKRGKREVSQMALETKTCTANNVQTKVKWIVSE